MHTQTKRKLVQLFELHAKQPEEAFLETKRLNNDKGVNPKPQIRTLDF